MFVVVSALCGLLIAGVALPAVGAAVFTGKAAEDELDDLPVAFDPPAQSQRSKVLDVNGDVLAYFYDENRVYVQLDDIAPVMQQAIISIEDHRFYEHGPLDAVGTLRAFLTNLVAGGVTQGGSTITQQYVKMVQIEEAKKAGDDAGDRGRAGRQLRPQDPRAALRHLGGEDAQQGRDPRALPEHRLLRRRRVRRRGRRPALLRHHGGQAHPAAGGHAGRAGAEPDGQQPGAEPDRGSAAAQRGDQPDGGARRDHRRRSGQGARSKFNKKKVTTTINGCQGTDYPFLCDYVYRSLEQTPSLGDTVEERRADAIKRGGLVVKTKIDPKTQDRTQKAVSKVVGPTDPVISAMDMIEPGTGLIVAMAQSRPVMGDDAEKGQTYWNYSVTPEMGGAQGFQAGSTFKAFTAAAALEEGIPLSKRYNAARTMDFSGARFETCDGPQPGGRQLAGRQLHRCQRDDGHVPGRGVLGEHLLRPARPRGGHVQRSPDGREAGHRVEHQGRAGQLLRRQAVVHPGHPGGQPAVGGRGVRDLRLRWHPLRPDHPRVDHRQHRPGPRGAERQLRAGDQRGRRQRHELAAVAVMTKGTGRRVLTADGRPQAGKTGTIDSNAAVWFAGYTPQVAGAAMISIDNTRARS